MQSLSHWGKIITEFGGVWIFKKKNAKEIIDGLLKRNQIRIIVGYV